MYRLLRSRRGNWTMISLLAACGIGLGLLAYLFVGRLAPGEQAKDAGLVAPKEGQTIVGASIDKAKETECNANIRQIRMTMDAYKAENGRPPATLQDLNMQVSAGLFSCPVSGQPYQYDPNTGSVTCSTPGHEGF